MCIHTHTIRIFFKPPAFVHFPTSFPNCQDTWITGIHQNEATKTRVRGGLVDLPTRKDVYRHSEMLVAVTLLAVSNLTKDFFAKGRGLPWGEREGAKKSSYFFDGTERLIATLDTLEIYLRNGQHDFWCHFQWFFSSFPWEESILFLSNKIQLFLHIRYTWIMMCFLNW